MRRTWVALLLALAGSSAPAAQTPLQWEQGVNSLNSGWRMHAGDNSAWAAPEFDDSDWKVTSLDAPQPPIPGKFDEYWYRLQLDLPARQAPLALLIEDPFNGTHEIYLNGRLIPGARLRSAWTILRSSPGTVIPIESSGPTAIALHVRIPGASIFHYRAITIHASVGSAGAIAQADRDLRDNWLNSYVVPWGIQLLTCLAGFALIALSRFQRGRREYLWGGLYLLCLTFINNAQSPAMFVFVELPAIYLAPITQIEFTFSFAGLPVTRGWRVYQGMLLLALPTLLPLLWIGALDFYPYQAIEAALLLPATVILPALLLAWYWRGNAEAGWLILPSLLPMLSICVEDLGLIGLWLGSQPLRTILNRIPIGALSVGFIDLANFAFLVAIGVVIFLRFNRVSQQQARAAAELEAAQRVQSLLLRSAYAEEDRFGIEADYRPAAEVGGDLFHTMKVNSSTRIVVGDVSGKGLGAAMLVSAVIGALDVMCGTDPADVLRQLNELLLKRQQSGFVTCLCVLLSPKGMVRLASAGHLPPYLDGQELSLDNGLPLGLTPDASYTETSFQLLPNAQLTLLSDGVVEARSASGELFGFDRTREISRRSAKAIADIAARFGQEDDITVLTVAHLPASAAV